MSIFRDISGKRLQEQEPQQKDIKKSSFSQLEESSFRNLSIETFKHTPIKNLELETSFKGREVVIVGHAQEGERASLQADDNTPVNFFTTEDWSTSQYDSFDLIRSTKNALIFDDSIANPLTNENSEIARSLFRKINFTLAAQNGVNMISSWMQSDNLTNEEKTYLKSFVGIATKIGGNGSLTPNEYETWMSNIAREVIFKDEIPPFLDYFSKDQKEYLLNLSGAKTALYLGFTDKIYPTFPDKDMKENVECLETLADQDMIKREYINLIIEDNKRLGNLKENELLIESFKRGTYHVDNPIKCFLAIESYYEDKKIEMSPVIAEELSKFNYLFYIHRGQSVLRNIENILNCSENEGKKIIIFSKFANLNLHKQVIEDSDNLKRF